MSDGQPTDTPPRRRRRGSLPDPWGEVDLLRNSAHPSVGTSASGPGHERRLHALNRIRLLSVAGTEPDHAGGAASMSPASMAGFVLIGAIVALAGLGLTMAGIVLVGMILVLVGIILAIGALVGLAFALSARPIARRRRTEPPEGGGEE